jgi:hypothetical protein
MEQGLTNRKPPRLLEYLVSVLVPVNYREQVLGDLSERYRSPLRYLADAASAVPAAIICQMRRTIPFPVLFLQTCCVCLSFLTAAVCLRRVERQSLSQIAATTALVTSGLLLWRVYLSQRYVRRAMLLRLLRPDAYHAIYFCLGVAWTWESMHRGSNVFAPILTSLLGLTLSAALVSRLWNWADAHYTPRSGGAR